jgi:putative addiction module component (TIGR02574 family)
MWGMDILFEEVQRQASLLPLREKALLAKILVEELDPETDDDVEQLWLAESKRRLEAYRRGEIKADPGDEVMSRLFARLQ